MVHWHLTSDLKRNKTFWQMPKRQDHYCVIDPFDCTTYSNSYAEGINVTKISGSHTEYDKDGRSIRNEQLLVFNRVNLTIYLRFAILLLLSSSIQRG
jgi:hypothetical protein